MEDKRVSSRIEKEIKSEVHSDDGMTFSSTVNISDGGLFISTPEPLKEGSQISLSLYLPDKEIIDVNGVVKWNKDTDSETSKAGMGIEFIELPESDLEKIMKILQ